MSTQAQPAGKPIEASDAGVAALSSAEGVEPKSDPAFEKKPSSNAKANSDQIATLSDGRKVTLREPTASDLRGIKLLDVFQLDTAAHAPLIERISDLGVADFYALNAADATAVMATVLVFFGDLTETAPTLAA